MTAVSTEQLSKDMQSRVQQLEAAGLVPQSQDQPINANDLLFYLTGTSMPMADLLQQHGLFLDDHGLNYDLAQFDAIGQIASKVISERQAGYLDGVWEQLDLSTDEDMDSNGTYILTALAALQILYGS
ncbi:MULTISPECIES: hypothetical protein [unclassified Agrobacterium]|uniref:Uncharacterized protein n=1 Tax=Agrobacterium fabrum TaxID=1176649 RepID=A0A2W5FDQ0_9HYPH|nr:MULTISPECIES: hypothetical protein [unclassified Agrobacterium]PZP54161.1 MAG: hypothetical protein DI595_00855 [Agrobacterium fabrum]MDH0616233.1 hypothetical protein [Agrobacterium sp. GD03872]MDH0698868.1 hypothetical protein [Agrobacterium sp. GD03871]MDH1060972.1 hypothetical protein [Agrobacterium sp. GD03992]MDH2211612.1 hypothetical protein [Agrobacterium sp. GD03643]